MHVRQPEVAARVDQSRGYVSFSWSMPSWWRIVACRAVGDEGSLVDGRQEAVRPQRRSDDRRLIRAKHDNPGARLISYARFKGPTRLSLSNLFGLLPDPLRSRWHGPNITCFARVCCGLAKLYEWSIPSWERRSRRWSSICSRSGSGAWHIDPAGYRFAESRRNQAPEAIRARPSSGPVYTYTQASTSGAISRRRRRT